jgi:hypothetical protein
MTYSDAGVENEVRDSYGVRKTEPYTIIMTISKVRGWFTHLKTVMLKPIVL